MLTFSGFAGSSLLCDGANAAKMVSDVPFEESAPRPPVIFFEFALYLLIISRPGTGISDTMSSMIPCVIA